MKVSFTSLDMVRHIYNEMNNHEAKSFINWLKADPLRLEEYEKLHSQSKSLSKNKYKPSDTSIRIILDYSRRGSAELV